MAGSARFCCHMFLVGHTLVRPAFFGVFLEGGVGNIHVGNIHDTFWGGGGGGGSPSPNIPQILSCLKL